MGAITSRPTKPGDDNAPAGAAAGLLAEVGARVRAARLGADLTRKKLSELSGVSQRYLAALEAGDGNISIARLHQVAAALGRPLASLITEGDDVSALYAAASPSQRQRALDILDGRQKRRRVALIGLRGAGKTTLGRLLGESLAWPFVELNREIEAQSGIPVNEVIALYGQEGYRRLERQALERVAAGAEPLVLAVAGGLVTEPETFRFLLGHFHAVWLKAAPDEHMQRVRAQGDERPMAGNPKAMEELNALLRDREALYASAAATLDTSGKTVADSRAELLQTLRTLGLA